MERNVALRLRYIGTRYHGWQLQKDLPTICGTVEQALMKLCGQPVRLAGCGRTDAGVHARRYCANFHTRCSVPTDRFPLALNPLLPPDISVMCACEAEPGFHAIHSCEKKEYIYRIFNSRIRDPFYADRACFYPAPLDTDIMKRAAEQFVGTHDFAAVRSVGTETRTTVRTVYWYEVERTGDIITLRVCADGFLYNMVRAMAGTLIYASEGKLRPEDIPKLLEKRDRRLTGPTMPAGGLYMNRVWYSGPVGAMMQAELPWESE